MLKVGLIQQPLIGVLCALGAYLAFSFNDVGIKSLSGTYALHQVIFIRTMIALIITVAIFVPLEGGFHILKTKRLGIHLIRGCMLVFANMMFFLGLASLPLSEATALFFISPMVITIFSVIFLGEKVGAFRWGATWLGLLGVLIMLRPGTETFRAAALFPLAAAVGYGMLHILTRKIRATEKASSMAFYLQTSFVLVSAVVGLAVGDGRFADGTGHASTEFMFRAWTWPTSIDFAIMAGVGTASAFGGYLISQAYRLSEAALIAPFEYLLLVLAIIWGITIFEEWPDLLAWAGIALILSAGMILVWREFGKSKVASDGQKPDVWRTTQRRG